MKLDKALKPPRVVPSDLALAHVIRIVSSFNR